MYSLSGFTADQIIQDASNGEVIRIRDEFYPVFRLYEMYNIPTEVTNIEDGILIWVETADESYCLFVDELAGGHETVSTYTPSIMELIFSTMTQEWFVGSAGDLPILIRMSIMGIIMPRMLIMPLIYDGSSGSIVICWFVRISEI